MRLHKPSLPGIRVQLTFWYTLVSAILVSLFCIAFYTLLQQLQAASFDAALQQRAQQVAEGVSKNHNKLIVDDVVDELPELDATAAIIDAPNDKDKPHQDMHHAGHQARMVSQYPPQNIGVRVLDTSGVPVYTTPAFSSLHLPRASVEAPLKGIPWRGTVIGPHNEEYRVYSTMLVDKQGIRGIVQVGQSLAKLNASLQHTLFILIFCILLALTSCAIGSYWLAGRAFRPIHRLTYTAREIGARELHQRVPIPPAKDEVRDLAIIFNQMIARLERAFTQQRRFVADASHELRTPVAAIRNMTEVALSHCARVEDYVAVLHDVNAETERLGKLINDLLALARADEGQVQLDHEPVRLDLLAVDVVESLAPLAEERKIALHTDKLDAATVTGDAARLIQVIMGLVDNALTYTNAGGEVVVSVEACPSHVHLSVRDTGIGIADKDIGHIFERFYRADPARSKSSGGSGLGLSIVDWIVRAHNGSVTVASQVGAGSTFLVTLLRTQEHVVA